MHLFSGFTSCNHSPVDGQYGYQKSGKIFYCSSFGTQISFKMEEQIWPFDMFVKPNG